MNKKIPLIVTIILTFTILSASIFFTACKKDDTKGCDRTCYFGSWATAHEYDDATIIASSTDPNGIIIQDVFWGSVTAIVNGSSFTIPFQLATLNDDYSGSGTLSDDGKTISISYIENGNQKTDTWTKQ